MALDLDLDTVADELYGLLPGAFTSTRDARAKEIRQSGDAALAAAIKGLKRPTSSAWLVNLLVRRRAEQVEELLDLGSAMREAQAQFAGDEIRRLSQQRRQIVRALSRAAGALARDIGQPISDQAERELETTLDAAIADPAAAEAVGSGRLTAALSPSAIGSLDLAGAMESLPEKPEKRAARPKESDVPAPRAVEKDDPHSGRRRETAELALLQAEAVATAARSEVAELTARVTRARDEHRRLRQSVSDLAAQLERGRAGETAAAKHLGDAERAREAAVRSAKAAEQSAHQARRSLDRLRK